MAESIFTFLVSLRSIGTIPLYEGVLAALEAAVVLGICSVGAGLWIGSLLTRPWRASPTEDPRAACRVHDWLRLDDGSFVCLRCNYRAGSSFGAVRPRPR